MSDFWYWTIFGSLFLIVFSGHFLLFAPLFMLGEANG
jgi:hypothetical protein